MKKTTEHTERFIQNKKHYSHLVALHALVEGVFPDKNGLIMIIQKNGEINITKNRVKSWDDPFDTTDIMDDRKSLYYKFEQWKDHVTGQGGAT